MTQLSSILAKIQDADSNSTIDDLHQLMKEVDRLSSTSAVYDSASLLPTDSAFIGSAIVTGDGGFYVFTDSAQWELVDSSVAPSEDVSDGFAWGGDRGAFFETTSNAPEYFSISTLGSASAWGSNLLYNHRASGVSSDASKLVIAGGNTHDDMEYLTWATLGTATSFGTVTDFNYTKDCGNGTCSDGTYGVFHSGNTNVDVVEATTLYFTFASSGNASSGAELTSGRRDGGLATDGTYGVYAAGYVGTNVIDYFAIANQSAAATDFGDATQARYGVGALSDATYSVFAGGYTSTYVNTIDYITTATPGNATDFGDLATTRYNTSGVSNNTLGVFCGGYANGSYSTSAEYLTIATPGNATNHSDLTFSYAHRGNSASGAAA